MCKQSGVEEGKGGYTWGHTVNKQSLAPAAVCMEVHVRGYTMCKQSEVEEGKGGYTWGHTVNKQSLAPAAAAGVLWAVTESTLGDRLLAAAPPAPPPPLLTACR